MTFAIYPHIPDSHFPDSPLDEIHILMRDGSRIRLIRSEQVYPWETFLVALDGLGKRGMRFSSDVFTHLSIWRYVRPPAPYPRPPTSPRDLYRDLQVACHPADLRIPREDIEDVLLLCNETTSGWSLDVHFEHSGPE